MKEFKLSINEQDLSVIVNALAQQPYRAVVSTMARLEQQVKAQEEAVVSHETMA